MPFQSTVELSSGTDRGRDVVSLLREDHDALRMAFSRVMEERHGHARRERLAWFTPQLVRHDTAEQIVLYPVIARIEGGPEFRREVLSQEKGLAIALAQLLRRFAWRPGGRRSLRQLHCFAHTLEQHLAFEEASLIPILLVLEDDRKRQMMGTWLRAAEPWTPIRPHPHLPQRLPGLMTVGVALGVLDRITDRALGRSRNGVVNHRP